MEILDLIYVSKLSDVGNLGRAATVLGINASTLSRRISAIEDELGVSLFERGRTGSRLTAAGLNVMRLVRSALGDIETIRLQAAQSGAAMAGRVRLATQVSTLGPRLRPALAAWRSQHLQVGFELSEVDDREALSGLRDRRIDAAVILGPVADFGLASRQLWQERLLLAVSEEDASAARGPILWTTLRRRPMLVRGRNSSQTLRDLQARLLGPECDLRIHQAGSLELLNLVALGEGATLVCESYREITFPGVTYLEVEEDDARVQVTLAWRPEMEDPVAGSFVAFMRDHRWDSSPSAPERTRDPSP